MRKNINNINATITAIVMAMSLAACGGADSDINVAADVNIETAGEVQAEEAEEETPDSEGETEVEEPGESEEEAEPEEASEESVEEEVSDETSDYKIMHFIEWGSGRGIHSSFKVNPEDEWSDNIDFWCDYDIVDGRCQMNRKIEGLYYEAPIDFTRLVTGDKEDTYIMVCDQDRNYVIGYFIDESQMDSCFPWEGYDKVVNGHFAVWYKGDGYADIAQQVLESCIALRGEEVDTMFTELYGRYVPES